MQYATAIGDKSLGTVEDFCKHLGVPMPEPEEKLTLRASDLTERHAAGRSAAGGRSRPQIAAMDKDAFETTRDGRQRLD